MMKKGESKRAVLYPVDMTITGNSQFLSPVSGQRMPSPTKHVVFSAVTDERETFSSNVTDYAVEDGQSISDHVQVLPEAYQVDAVMTGRDALGMKDKLYKYWQDGQVLRYVGRSIFHSVVIRDMHIDTGVNIANGYFISLSLKQVRTSAPEYVELPAPDPTVADTIRIMQSIAAGEDTYTVADVIRIQKQIVGITSDTAEIKDSGYVEIDEEIPIDKLRIPYTAEYGIPAPAPTVRDAIVILQSIVFDDDTEYTVRDAIRVLRQVVGLEKVESRQTVARITWHYNRINDSFSADISADGTEHTGRKLLLGRPMVRLRTETGHAMVIIPQSRHVERITWDNLESVKLRVLFKNWGAM